MEKTRLEKVRAYESKQKNSMNPEWKPVYHVAAPVGWVNDPNGFSIYQDEVHLFFQYYPYDTAWGPMHWGHCKSKDFIDWEYLPAVMAPDQGYDNFGCFSGSAIESDGKHVLIYTGVMEEEQEDGSKKTIQVQCGASGDGLNYTKWDCNPIITADSLPEGSSFVDFRDPKVWKKEGMYYLAVGSKHSDGSGQIALYQSKDLRTWEYRTILDRCRNEYGQMWECPDFFPLGDKHLLITSPQYMKEEGLRFHKGNGVICVMGNYDEKEQKFTREKVTPVDYGIDFYAPQSLKTKDGRRVIIAWMQSWDANVVPKELGWVGMMTIPRELELVDGELVQRPVRELNAYRKNLVRYENVELSGAQSLEGISGRVMDLNLTIEQAGVEAFCIHIGHSEEYTTTITWNPQEETLEFDRNGSGVVRDMICSRKMRVNTVDGRLTMRMLLDRFSAEIFVNDGRQVMSNTFYTPLNAAEILFEVKGKAKVTVEKYEICLPCPRASHV